MTPNSDKRVISKNDCTLVFVTYNSAQLIDTMLRELEGYPVLVYDNASVDDTVSHLQKNYPQVRLHSNSVNSGYGRAANAAFRQIDTPYALLINPDVDIQREQIDALIDTINTLGENWLFVAPDIGTAPTAYPTKDNDPLPRIRFAGGSALLFDLATHWSLGGFDENIFLFYEETDLCERAVVQNIKMYYAEQVKMPHASGQSVAPSAQLNSLKRWHYHWSYLYFSRKHRHWAALAQALVKSLLVYPVKLLYVDAACDKAHVYRCRRSATLAFLSGKKAFNDDGLPFIPTIN